MGERRGRQGCAAGSVRLGRVETLDVNQR